MISRLGIAFASALGLLGCATTVQPAPGPVQPVQPVQPVAADNGQPRMQAALQALAGAQSELTAASPNKGGHREAALNLIAQAQQEVQAGMQYAQEHPSEIGAAEGPAAPLPVDEEVPGAGTQPRMRNAV